MLISLDSRCPRRREYPQCCNPWLSESLPILHYCSNPPGYRVEGRQNSQVVHRCIYPHVGNVKSKETASASNVGLQLHTKNQTSQCYHSSSGTSPKPKLVRWLWQSWRIIWTTGNRTGVKGHNYTSPDHPRTPKYHVSYRLNS